MGTVAPEEFQIFWFHIPDTAIVSSSAKIPQNAIG